MIVNHGVSKFLLENDTVHEFMCWYTTTKWHCWKEKYLKWHRDFIFKCTSLNLMGEKLSSLPSILLIYYPFDFY